MDLHPIAFIVRVALLGIALAFGLVTYARRGDNPRGRGRILLWGSLLLGALLVTVDFFLTPAHRWLNGVTLALAALIVASGYGYERFRRSKARPKR